MRRVVFITHPEVTIDPETPVPLWHLSDLGRQRMASFVSGPALQGVTSVYSSTETKAREAAAILAGALRLPVVHVATLGENDRSATGYLEKDVFEAAADAFFGQPDVSHRGWETATAAQRRVVEAVSGIVREAPAGDMAVVSHGAVGTLLKCHVKQVHISCGEDQASQGNWYAFDADGRWLLSDWAPISPAELTAVPR